MTTILATRRVCSDDSATIAGHRYFRGESQEDVDAYASWLPPRMARGTYIGFVAEAEGRVIAGAGAVLLDWGPTRGEPSGARARLVNVFTEAHWRRQGIARALVNEVMKAGDAVGIRVFSLAATPDGLPMYVSLGFVPYANEMILRRP